ncbi:phage tail spike protein [Staphylococcus coagulans]|uniref:Phage tail spike protein n=1 Tax=Staphylococcus coagulans TaxID=74706 RepID=A0ABU1EXA1_9STAP|nr:phage tail spike protein [Staphylococcus coagulans]MDR5602759.1 phage tail spike protein [Staphylococcus coagulans]
MIHVMNFKGEIIDYISRDDNALIKAMHHRNINDRTETFDFTILSERTINMQERNRIIIQDKNGQYREFIIDHISQDIDGYTEIETVASYLEDIAKAKPYAPHKFEKMTTKQALADVLKDTGWLVSDATEYGGIRTTSWTSYQTRYEVLLQLCTTYKMMVDFYIEIGSNSVEKRYVVLRKRQPLFNGKEITYGKDLTGLKRTVDYSEVKTALLCVGPEKEGGKRIELIVKDDDAQARIGLPGRYNWGIYEPETEDENMDEKRLRTLGTTELNKRKKEAISYEVTALDIQKAYSHEVVNLGDMVRIKNRDFTPPLYVEAEVISEEYDMIAEDVVYGFGEYVEYREKDLRDEFTKKLDDIRSKLNDSISNINTIVKDSVDGQLEYFERKIIKSATPPENPVNDMLWLDISNPDVPVLKRYWNGQWILASVDDVEKIGGITREKALFSELKNTFVNLSIQHSKLLKEMYEILSSEYLVDEDLKSEVNTKLDATIEVYNQIKANLESMTENTATIGKLIDTQALFLTYRQKLQDLYNSVEKAKLAIEKRFKLLQSQYTDEKFNDAMTEIANVLPNGHWDPDTKQLTSDIPNKDDLEQMRLKLIESLEPINDRIESIRKEVKNYENGMELTIDKKIKEYNNGSGNIYRYSNPLVFKEADYYKATSITNEPEKSIRYNYKTEINFGALDYYKWEVGKPYTFSFTIKVDTPFVVVDTLNDGNKLHPAKLEIPSNEWQRKSITFIPESEDSSKGITLNLSIDTGDSGIEWAGIVGTGSSIGAISVKDFQLEKGDEASPQKPNVNDLDESYKYITNKVIQSTAKISAFEDRINLKADKSEVTQTLDEKLQPIKNEVQQQNANIELLPNKLTEQVSQQIYETTISGLVKRLEAEESKRETLANQINDTVSIRQYQAGIQEAKEYADEQLKDVANAPGIREGIAQANEEAQESLRQYINAQDALKQQESQAYVDGQISAEEQRAINEAKQKLSEAKRHAEDKANEAQRLSNSYTDGQIRNANRERDQILTQYDSRISQNGREIALRTTKNEFNATNRTLSRVMSEIVQNVTTGATIRFDDNGTAQSLNVGPQGIQLNGDKINLNASRQFNLLVSNMDSKVDKNAVISSINASPERVDINTQNIGIRGGSGQSYVDIRNDQIELGGGFRRTWRGRSTRHDIFTRLKDGHLRFRNNALDRSLYMSEFGISTYIDGEGEGQGSSGTIQWWDTTYSQSNANGITINSYGGVVALSSDTNRIVLDAYASSNVESKTAAVYIHPHKDTRPGNNRFAFTVSNADHSSNTDGYIMYGSDTNYNYGAGLRFSKSQNGKTVQVVDGNYSTGGDTTIEAGYGSFNTISKRDGNGYVRIISDDGFLVGRDNAGNRIASKFIYNRTYSGSPNLHITGEGTLGRSTSAMKYKALIEKQFDDNKRQLEHSQHILDLDVKSWFDKHEVENYAREIVEGEKLDEDKYKISRHVGLIAEDLAEAGLTEHVVYGYDGEIEGIEYDRLWIHLLPVIKELKDKIKVLEEKQNESK